MLSENQVYDKFVEIINEQFEVPTEEIVMDAKLYEDLNLDSIDAIDLIGQVQVLVGQRLNPEEFKSVSTVGDVVAISHRLLSANPCISDCG